MFSGITLSKLASEHIGPLTFGSDRRAHARVAFDCPVRWGTTSADRLGWASDASDRGAGFCIRSSVPPQIGDRIELIFKLDNYFEWTLSRAAEVRWCTPVQDGVYQVGVQLPNAPARKPKPLPC